MNLWQDLRRRKIYRLIGIYVVGAWLAIQVASTFFPAWSIPDTALRYLIIAAALGFPVALVFGWLFDITADGIVRTASATESDTADLALRRPDYLILSALALIAVAILVGSFDKVRQATDDVVLGVESVDKPPNSIAILPFVNMNKDVDTEYFSDGVTEEILHHLSTLKTLRVMGRTSSFAFKNSDIALPRLSNILQVKYLLQGSVRRDRDQVRVTASLVDDSGYQVWSQTFDSKLEGIFAIQTEIADTVAGQLVRQIARPSASGSRVTENLDAYQEYLLGRDYLNRRGVDWKVSAKAAFEKSIELDSEFALPYAGLAVANSIGKGYSSVPDQLADAQALVDRALELQPDLAEAHAAQGLILFVGQNPNFAAAEAALRRAIDLDPNLVIAYNWLSTTVSSQGRGEESRAIQESGLAIDPLNPVINTNVAARFSAGGDFRRAEKLLLRLMDLPEPPSLAYWGLEALYYAYGRLDDALDWTKRIVRAHGPESRHNPYGVLAIIYEHLGMSSDSDYWFDKLVDDDADEMQILLRKSYILKLRGDYEGTKELLDNATRDGEIDYKALSIFAAQVIGALNISVGNVDHGIEILESVIDVDAPISTTAGGGVGALDFLQLLAYGHRQIGNDARATIILQKVQETFEYWSADGLSQSPRTMEKLALNQAMLGDTQRAFATLESAASLGWRNYFFVLNDQRWQETMQLPEFKSLMNWVKADLDRQRKRIEVIELKEDFRAYVEARDTSGQM